MSSPVKPLRYQWNSDSDEDDEPRTPTPRPVTSSYPLWKKLVVSVIVLVPFCAAIFVAAKYPHWRPLHSHATRDVFAPPSLNEYFSAHVPPERLISPNHPTPQCTDFYEHACREFLDQELPKDRTEWDYSFDGVHARIGPMMRTVLKADDSAAGTLYRSCVASDKIDAQGAAPLEMFLATVDGIDSNESLAAATAMLHSINSKAFFDWEVRPDPDSTVQMMYMQQGGLTLAHPSYYSNESSVEVMALSAFVKKMFEMTGIPSWSSGAAAASAIAVEEKLAGFHLSRKDETMAISLPPLTVDQVVKGMGPGFDWGQFFHDLGVKGSSANATDFNKRDFSTHGQDSSDPPAIRMLDVAFFKKLCDFLAAQDPASLRAYLRWRVLDSLVTHLGSKFAAEQKRFRAALFGSHKEPPRWQRCQDTLEAYTPLLMGRVYTRSLLEGSKVTSVVSIMLDDLQRAFTRVIAVADWMGHKARVDAIKKVRAVLFNVGGPRSWGPEHPFDVSKDWFNNSLAIARYMVSRQLDRMGTKLTRVEWSGSVGPMSVNAYYSVHQNSLFVPAALLQAPFVQTNEELSAADYGSLGALLGHELTHALDPTGRRFNDIGTYANDTAWDVNTTARYEQRAQCIGDYYRDFRTKAGGKTALDPNRTLDEDVADLGGLHIAYSALADLIQREKKLEVSKKTAAQLRDSHASKKSKSKDFFLAWAQTWCRLSNSRMANFAALTDPHAPARTRVNAALSQFPPFSKTFKCNPNDPMSPPSKPCGLW